MAERILLEHDRFERACCSTKASIDIVSVQGINSHRNRRIVHSFPRIKDLFSTHWGFSLFSPSPSTTRTFFSSNIFAKSPF